MKTGQSTFLWLIIVGLGIAIHICARTSSYKDSDGGCDSFTFHAGRKLLRRNSDDASGQMWDGVIDGVYGGSRCWAARNGSNWDFMVGEMYDAITTSLLLYANSTTRILTQLSFLFEYVCSINIFWQHLHQILNYCQYSHLSCIFFTFHLCPILMTCFHFFFQPSPLPFSSTKKRRFKKQKTSSEIEQVQERHRLRSISSSFCRTSRLRSLR